jgi:hypothetical protein
MDVTTWLARWPLAYTPVLRVRRAGARSLESGAFAQDAIPFHVKRWSGALPSGCNLLFGGAPAFMAAQLVTDHEAALAPRGARAATSDRSSRGVCLGLDAAGRVT